VGTMNQLVSAAEAGASEALGHNGSANTHAARRLRGAAVVGLGYWGPNWVRNFYQLQCADRVIACDLDEARCERIRSLFPSAETDLRFEDVLEDPDIEGVIIATPVSSHFPMARRRADGRTYVRIQLAGAQNSRGDIGGRAGRSFLRELDPGQPRTVPARRKRGLGPRHARHLDHPDDYGADARGCELPGREP